MNRFDSILQSLARWGSRDPQIQAALIIGSQAREDHPADDFSDLDLILVAEDPRLLLTTDDWLSPIGNVHISFVETTLGGAQERRVLFDGALDVDFIILSPADFLHALQTDDAQILLRGCRVLFDKQGLLPAFHSAAPRPYTPLSPSAFKNLVNDFWYHAVWTAKKLIRGELWTAKACLDCYMKQQLLTLLECHAHALHGPDYDTWHKGRYLEQWAEGWAVQSLSRCFAHYERGEMQTALLATMGLFRRVAKETAEMLGYIYPIHADSYAAAWVTQALHT